PPSSPTRSGACSRPSSAATRSRAPASACPSFARSSSSTAAAPGSIRALVGAPSSRSPGLPTPMRRPMDEHALNILLVDDDEVDVMTVQRAFAKANIANKVFIAGNGIEALQLLRTDGVPTARRLVLLDLNMPRMNGIEFLREIRQDPDLQSLTVVVLTTSNEDRDRVEAYQLNVAGYLLKPVTFHAFADVMATLNKYWTLMEMP